MATLDVTGMDELLKKLSKLSDKAKVDAIAKKAIDAGRQTVADAMRSSIGSMEYGPYATGSVSASVVSTPSKINSYGAYSVALPTGYDDHGTRNGEKAAYLEYGAKNLMPRPWRTRAVNSATGPAMKIIEDILKSEMELDS